MRPKKEGAIDGIRTRDLSLTKRVLCQLSYEGITKWRIRVSIPVPRRCERRTLPIELIPHASDSRTKMATPAGFEPARAKPNRFLIYRLNHSATVSSLADNKKSNPGGTRTPKLVLRSQARYPLRHRTSKWLEVSEQVVLVSWPSGLRRSTQVRVFI